MHSLYLCLLALSSTQVLATEEKSFWKNLLKRNDWNNAANYVGVDWKKATENVDWSKVFPNGGGGGGGGNNPQQAQPQGSGVTSSSPSTGSGTSSSNNGATGTDNHDQSSGGNDNNSTSSGSNIENKASKSNSNSNSNTDQSGSDHASSASCPDGCSMTISFTDNTLDVDFAAGSGGKPSTGKTKGTCICMSPGSVRVNIGTSNTGDHTTLIEGNAVGLSQSSFFDVSYVEGYNYPVTCWNADNPTLMSGSNVDLYSQGSCHDDGSTQMGHICVNPGYLKLATRDAAHDCMKCTLPSDFFGPASGAAYTYPYDDCGCASGPSANGPYKSPMATGGKLICCVGPHCKENTFSIGGQTKMGNCNRPDCKPCSGMGPTCSSGCSGGGSTKRDLEAVFEEAAQLEKEGRKKRRHTHHAHHHHEHE